MAEEKKTAAKAKSPKPAAAKAAPAKEAVVKAKAPKAPKAESKGGVTAGSKATPAAPEGQQCSVDKCKQPIRAKGMCRKHYVGWRRGTVGTAHRYKVCSKEGCRNPRTHGGLCDEHAGKAAPEAAAPAAAPAAT
jgi:hypothetical protein